MLVRVTDRNDGTEIMLNASQILLVRAIASGGSTIYLASGSLHHPDLLTVRETVDDLTAVLGLETGGKVTAVEPRPAPLPH